MIGTDLTQLDERTKFLLTNREVLAVQRFAHGAYQVRRDQETCVWASYGSGCPAMGQEIYVALFNLSESSRECSVLLEEISGIDSHKTYSVRNLWANKDLFPLAGNAILSLDIPSHGAILLRLK